MESQFIEVFNISTNKKEVLNVNLIHRIEPKNENLTHVFISIGSQEGIYGIKESYASFVKRIGGAITLD